jgi:hypothetical protein
MRRALFLLPLLIAGCGTPASLLSRVTGRPANGACWYCNETAHIPPELVDKPVCCGSCYASLPRGEFMMTHFKLLDCTDDGNGFQPPSAPNNRTEGVILTPLGKKHRPAPDPKENRVEYCPEARRYYRMRR